MVRQQQDKAPHRRLDDMRREEDRRMAEREQVTNHSHRTAAGPANRSLAWVFHTQHSSGPGMSVEWLPWQQVLKCSVCVGEPCAALHSIQFKLTETQKTNQHELVHNVPQDTLFRTTSHVHASHHTSFSFPPLNDQRNTHTQHTPQSGRNQL